MTKVTNHGRREAHERMGLHASEISIRLSIRHRTPLTLEFPSAARFSRPFSKISSCLFGFPRRAQRQRATRNVRRLGVLENTISGFTTYGMNACFSSNAPANFWNAAADSIRLAFLQATYDGHRRACPPVVGSYRRAPICYLQSAEAAGSAMLELQ